MNEGKLFEKAVRENCPSCAKFLRISDPAQSFNGASGLRFSNKNPYDIEIFKSPNLFALELKSTKEHSLSFERIGEKSNSSPNIKSYQLKGLLDASKFEGVVSGLLLNFRTSAKTYFIHINDFLSFMESTTKKSINESDICSMPNLVIEQTLMRVRYRYNIAKFLADCSQLYLKGM